MLGKIDIILYYGFDIRPKMIQSGLCCLSQSTIFLVYFFMNGPIFTFLVLRGDTGVLVPGALGYQVLPPAALQGSAVAHVTAHGLTGLDGDD